ncbi:MAG: ATP-binding protein [Planctomycetaceae bacterium]|nr:ATP-binding protein [Planctomycetaceae bacterium]
MKRILVVDDTRAQCAAVCRLLEQAGYGVMFACNAADSLGELTRSRCDLALVGRKSNGALGVVDQIRQAHPQIPVVVITGTVADDAADALRRGAVSYLPQRRVDRDLLPTLEQILGFTRDERPGRRKLEYCVEASARFVVGNDIEVIPPLVAHIDETLRAMRFGDDEVRIRIKVALTEAVTNAMLHGNLELDSELREGDGTAWDNLLRERRAMSPYHDRRVVVDYRLRSEGIEFNVRDEGPGFDPSRIPDPRCLESLQRQSGRGVLLMRTFMHEVRFNERGNEVTLVRHATR